MEAEAGLCVRVVGDLGAAIGVDIRVGFSGRDHLDATGVEQRTQLNAEGKGIGFFGLGVEVAAGVVVAAMSGIENDDKAGLGRSRCLRWGGRGLRGSGYGDGSCHKDRKLPEQSMG
jgi:hypothetical protein